MSWPLELSYSLAPDENDCDCCQGNGEIVTDWELYLHPPKGAPGDVGTAPCPACRAIPRAGYCKLAGCPTAPQNSDGGRG